MTAIQEIAIWETARECAFEAGSVFATVAPMIRTTWAHRFADFEVAGVCYFFEPTRRAFDDLFRRFDDIHRDASD
jgi:hypothetical protein